MYIHVCIYIDIVIFYFFLLFDLIITTTKNVNYKLDINNVLLFSFTEWELFRIIRNNRFLLLIDENYIMQIISLLKYDSCILIVEEKEKKKIIWIVLHRCIVTKIIIHIHLFAYCTILNDG